MKVRPLPISPNQLVCRWQWKLCCSFYRKKHLEESWKTKKNPKNMSFAKVMCPISFFNTNLIVCWLSFLPALVFSGNSSIQVIFNNIRLIVLDETSDAKFYSDFNSLEDKKGFAFDFMTIFCCVLRLSCWRRPILGKFQTPSSMKCFLIIFWTEPRETLNLRAINVWFFPLIKLLITRFLVWIEIFGVV